MTLLHHIYLRCARLTNDVSHTRTRGGAYLVLVVFFFHSEEREGLRIPEICLTDLDFADYIVLSDEIRQARQLLSNVEIDCGKVELLMNAKKTKGKYFNIEKEEMKTGDGTKITEVVVEETGEQDSNTWEAGYVPRKET